jgi:PhnB protein
MEPGFRTVIRVHDKIIPGGIFACTTTIPSPNVYKILQHSPLMTGTNTYLNFPGNTEEAFNFYKSVFGGEFTSLVRFKDMKMEAVSIPAADQDKIMHIGLPIGKNTLMATDALESLGQKLVQGNNVYISLHPDSKAEADRIFTALSKDGKMEMPISDQAWGDYYGSFKDKFGVQWMVIYSYAKTPITVETMVHAPVEKVWDYWTKPEHITQWSFASDDWEAPSAENDLRVGGKFKTRLAAKDKSAGFDFTGTYTRVDKHKLIEYDMDDGRHVTILFTPTPQGVKITETFDPEKMNSAEMQRSGWQAFLDNFKKYAERS